MGRNKKFKLGYKKNEIIERVNGISCYSTPCGFSVPIDKSERKSQFYFPKTEGI